VLVALILTGDHAVWGLVLVASVANTAGAVVNWGLGRLIHRYRERRWFPASPAALARAEGWYARWGYWSLMLSWAPLVGDPLTVVAGVLREPLWRFLILVALAKTGRYVTLAWITVAVGS
jgi:membrane protein YqaA with SNARE-associated domain